MVYVDVKLHVYLLTPPYRRPPFSPSLISLVASVDIKHRVYLLWVWHVKKKKKKEEETVSHRQSNNIKEVAIPPVPSNLCTPQLALSAAVWNKVTKTVSETATVEKQLSSKDNRSRCESPALPPSSDLSRVLITVFASSFTVLYVHRNHKAF